MGGKPSIYRIFELDDEFCKIREIQARLTLNDLFEHIMEDTRGCFHITFWRENEFHTYVVISPEGETIFESDLGERPGEIRLCAFGEGRVAVSETIYNGNKIEHNFYEADLEAGSLKRIAVLEDKKVKEKMSEKLFAVTLVNDDEITWCDSTGIWLYDMKNQKMRLAYEWSKHEIDPHEIYDCSVNNDGSIGLVYVDHYGLRYLLLKSAE